MMSVNVAGILLASMMLAALFTESQAAPGMARRIDFPDIDCTEVIVCDKSGPSVCATDGTTYTNDCKLRLANQIKKCMEGDFNPIMPVHPGTCDD